ncbi:MAG: hypothetical protein EHM36_06025 [Deltaproteobacteria bacterium]|nr:MAG: hypothetical protein EHM36_06025 [Deltaproteobacteria bacterium]
MIETTIPITPKSTSNFETVQNQFQTWRNERPCRGRIPEALWEAAVGLCKERSVFEVSRTLRLNYKGLRNRVLKAKGMSVVERQSDLGFVKLNFGVPVTASECMVEMEAPNGATMRMSLKGVSREFDPVELSRAFWRQGR